MSVLHTILVSQCFVVAQVLVRVIIDHLVVELPLFNEFTQGVVKYLLLDPNCVDLYFLNLASLRRQLTFSSLVDNLRAPVVQFQNRPLGLEGVEGQLAFQHRAVLPIFELEFVVVEQLQLLELAFLAGRHA